MCHAVVLQAITCMMIALRYIPVIIAPPVVYNLYQVLIFVCTLCTTLLYVVHIIYIAKNPMTFNTIIATNIMYCTIEPQCQCLHMHDKITPC